MVLTMAPTVAFAADTTSDPAAQSNPVAQIKGAQKSSVYFGNYKQSSDGNGDYLTEPIKWRVLQSADGKLFLLADKILDVYYYHHNGSTSIPGMGDLLRQSAGRMRLERDTGKAALRRYCETEKGGERMKYPF